MLREKKEKIKSAAWKVVTRGAIPLQVLYAFFASRAYAITISGPQDIGKVILCPIAIWMFWILIALSTIIVLYAAFLYLTGRGEDDNISKARRTITYAAVAIVVALLARGFPNLVAAVLGQSDIVGCS